MLARGWIPFFGLLVLASWALSHVHAAVGRKDGIRTLTIHPTSNLLWKQSQDQEEKEALRRELSNGSGHEWQVSSVYAPFQEIVLEDEKNDPNVQRHNNLAREFNKERHLMRHTNGEGHRQVSEIGGTYDSFETASIFNSGGYAKYYTTLLVGTDLQPMSLIIDTSSIFTSFPCDDSCADCGKHLHAPFDSSKSEGFHRVSCDENQCSNQQARCSLAKDQCEVGYWGVTRDNEESSWRAYQARDRISCPNSDLIIEKFLFGCQMFQQGPKVKEVTTSGVLGMGQDNDSLVAQLWAQNKIDNKMFSVCLKHSMESTQATVVSSSGLLTIGGIDQSLHESPMVYAKSVSRIGPYSVFVKKAFVRTGSSGSFSQIAYDEQKMNKMGGVIVDSGSVDSYFHPSLGKSFKAEWKKRVGLDYSNSAMKLTKVQLSKLPSLVLQLQAFDSTPDPSIDYSDHKLWGMVGSVLDSESPHDVLLEITPMHYMEYNRAMDMYTPRLYFTVAAGGGVLGANAMQGHDVLFDLENGRIGLAKSSCSTPTPLPQQQLEGTKDADKAEGHENTPGDNDNNVGNQSSDNAAASDCHLGPKVLKKSCEKSVDVGICKEKSPDIEMEGTEVWVQVVEKAATHSGQSCGNVMLDHGNYPSHTRINCSPEGTCHAKTSCRTTCKEVLESTNGEAIDLSADHNGKGTTEKEDGSASEGGIPCGDSTFWSECEYSCKQTRLIASMRTDGVCVAAEEETRACHIDACGRYDPCVVPFVVHAVMGFKGGNVTRFDRSYVEKFADAFSKTVNKDKQPEDEIFGPGDVKVLQVMPWIDDTMEYWGVDDAPETKGMKVTAEISIFNPQIRPPSNHDEKKSGKEDSTKGAPSNRDDDDYDDDDFSGNDDDDDDDDDFDDDDDDDDDDDNPRRRLPRRKDMPPRASCTESDSFPLGRNAYDVHTELQRGDFMSQFLHALLREEKYTKQTGGKSTSPFQDSYSTSGHEMLASWTIKTEVQENAEKPTVKSSLKHDPFGFLAILFLIVVGAFAGYFYGRHRLSDMKGEYKKVLSLAEDDEIDEREHDNELDVEFSDRFRGDPDGLRVCLDEENYDDDDDDNEESLQSTSDLCR